MIRLQEPSLKCSTNANQPIRLELTLVWNKPKMNANENTHHYIKAHIKNNKTKPNSVTSEDIWSPRDTHNSQSLHKLL